MTDQKDRSIYRFFFVNVQGEMPAVLPYLTGQDGMGISDRSLS